MTSFSPSIHLFHQSRSIIPFNISIRINKNFNRYTFNCFHNSCTISFLKFADTSQFYPSPLVNSNFHCFLFHLEFWKMLNTDLEFPREKRRKRGERKRKGRKKDKKKKSLPPLGIRGCTPLYVATHGQIVQRMSSRKKRGEGQRERERGK